MAGWVVMQGDRDKSATVGDEIREVAGTFWRERYF